MAWARRWLDALRFVQVKLLGALGINGGQRLAEWQELAQHAAHFVGGVQVSAAFDEIVQVFLKAICRRNARCALDDAFRRRAASAAFVAVGVGYQALRESPSKASRVATCPHSYRGQARADLGMV